jgi:hypothetical protein
MRMLPNAESSRPPACARRPTRPTKRQVSLSGTPHTLRKDFADGYSRCWAGVTSQEQPGGTSLLRREAGCNRLNLKEVIAIKLVAAPRYQLTLGHSELRPTAPEYARVRAPTGLFVSTRLP